MGNNNALQNYEREYQNLSPLANDTVVPVQFFSIAPQSDPEKALMAAVLEDALSIIARGPNNPYYQETVEWFMSDDSNWLYSISNICLVIDICLSRLRKALASRRLRPIRSTARNAPHGKMTA